MKKFYLIVFTFLLCGYGYANAASMNDKSFERRSRVAKQYKQLKQKAVAGNKVRVIVKYKDEDVAPGKMQKMSKQQAFDKAYNKVKSKGFNALKKLKYSKLAVYELDSQQIDELIDSGVVERVQEDIVLEPHLLQSIPHIGADIAHDNGYIGIDQAVVIIDTGIDSMHQFLAGRVVEEACFSSNSSDGNVSSLCPNGQEQQVGTGAGIDCSRTGISSCSHGTHVAGIAAGINQEMNGVAYGANIVSVQVFSEYENYHESCGGLERCVRAYWSDIISALDWVRYDAVTDNIAAINMSLGGGKYLSYCDTNYMDIKRNIDGLRAMGIATVISSGNDRYSDAVGAPGCISSAITVGSTGDSYDTISYYSNGASMVDVLAPGQSIYSSKVNNRYGTMSGTSMAAPHVTGAIAVLKSINPNASVDEIEQVLEDNGQSILDSRNNLTFPRLDLNASTIAFENKPIAKLDNNSYSVMVGNDVEFTAYSSSDPNNSSLTYIWDFGDGISDYQTSDANVDHIYNAMGTYELGLVVDNGEKFSDLDTASVTVYDPTILSIIISMVLF